MTKEIKYFLSDECEHGAISLSGWCEHCYVLENDDIPTVSDGGTWWCADCWECDHDVDINKVYNNLLAQQQDIPENHLYPEKTVEECVSLEIPKIKYYSLLTFEFPSDLIDSVANYIENGWEPLGGISVDNDMLYQAMVKYD